MESQCDWSSLPPDVLGHAMEPFLRFIRASKAARLVCHHWHLSIPMPTLYVTESALRETGDSLEKVCHLIQRSNHVKILRDHVELFPAVAANRSIKHLDLAKIRLDSRFDIDSQLKHNPSLRRVTITQCTIAEQNVSPFCKALASNLKLRELRIINLVEKGLKAIETSPLGGQILAAVQSSPTLRLLQLSSVNLLEHDIPTFSSWITSNTMLTTLNLSSCNFRGDWKPPFACLANNATLRNLIIRDAPSFADGAFGIASALELNVSLTKLDLYKCNLRAEHLIAIAQSLENNISVTALSLGRNTTPIAKLADIYSALSVARSLRSLSIDRISEGDWQDPKNYSIPTNGELTFLNCSESVSAHFHSCLIQVLSLPNTLVELHVSQMSFQPHTAVALFVALKASPFTKKFVFSGNNFGFSLGADLQLVARGLFELVRENTTLTDLNIRAIALGPEAAAIVAPALLSNTALQSLQVEQNILGATGTAVFARAVSLNTTLKSLFIGFNASGEAGAEAIRDMLKQNRSLTHLSLRSSGIRIADIRKLLVGLNDNGAMEILDLRLNEHLGVAPFVVSSWLRDSTLPRILVSYGSHVQ